MEKRELNDKNHTGDTHMIIPVRCKSCGKPIGHLYEEFVERSAKKEDKQKVMDELGLKRYCCRAHFLGHVNLVDTAAQFKKY
jgi:DNA-directed RNA polymerase subunit N